MNVALVGKKRGVSSTQLLMAAGLALVLAAAGFKAYPFLVGFGAAGALLTTVRAVSLACLFAVGALPVAAIVRRLIR